MHLANPRTRSNERGSIKRIAMKQTVIRSVCRVDADGSRFLLGDCNGILHVLVLTSEQRMIKVLADFSLSILIS